MKKTDVTPGCIIEKIDGKPIVKGQDYFPLLEGKAGRKVLLAIYNPATGKRFDITIKAISTGEQSNLLYKRWVERCRNIVDKLSEGRIGYVQRKRYGQVKVSAKYIVKYWDAAATKKAIM